MPLNFLLNGRPVDISTAQPHTTLLDFLRAQGLTGAKEGCAEGECGACAVAFVADDEAGAAYRVVNSCLMFLPAAADHEIYTVESLASNGDLVDAQRVIADAGGSQCGYCTPGFVMSLFCEQYRPDRVGPCSPLALAGNLCRCTGYRPIRDAALALGPPSPGEFRDRVGRPAPHIRALAGKDFSRPSTVDQCLALLAVHPDATLVAGGSDLCVESNLHGKRWTHLIGLESIDELRECSDTPASVRLGAAVSLTEIARRWKGAPDVFHQWLELFASPAIRNRATLGGNLVTASPIGDAAPLLAALDAVVHVQGRDGRRAIPLSAFFPGYRRTAMRPGEMVTVIEIPKPLPQLVCFYKVAKRRLDDISTVAAAMALDRDRAGRISRARFAFGGIAPTPVRIVEAEDAIAGQSWNEAAVERVQNILDARVSPISDHRGSARYRKDVSKQLVEKFWWEHRS